jgi:hypothetical protein
LSEVLQLPLIARNDPTHLVAERPWDRARREEYGPCAGPGQARLRLVCDGFSAVLQDPAAPDFVEALCEGLTAAPGWTAGRLRLIEGERIRYRFARRRGGICIQWGPVARGQAPARILLRPRDATEADWAALRSLVQPPTVIARVTRLDVAVDYAVPTGAVELLGLRATSGSIYTVTRRVQEALVGLGQRRGARAGSPRSAYHYRLYSHPADARPGDPTWTRLEAQWRPRARPGLRLSELAEIPDPFASVVLAVTRDNHIDYVDRLLLREVRRLGSAHVRRLLGATRFREFCDRVPTPGALGLPGPSEVFASHWHAIARALLRTLEASTAETPAPPGWEGPVHGSWPAGRR